MQEVGDTRRLKLILYFERTSLMSINFPQMPQTLFRSMSVPWQVRAEVRSATNVGAFQWPSWRGSGELIRSCASCRGCAQGDRKLSRQSGDQKALPGAVVKKMYGTVIVLLAIKGEEIDRDLSRYVLGTFGMLQC